MSSNVGSSTPTSRFLALAKTTKFTWFLGHFLVVLSSTFYWLSFRVTSLTEVWYRLIFVGALESFGLLVYQSYGKYFKKKTEATKSEKQADDAIQLRLLFRDENVLYLLLSTTWLVLSPRIAVATVPFFIISLFHVLTYTVNDFASNVLLVNDVKSHPYLKFLDSLVTQNHENSLNAICSSEILCLFYNILRLLTFRSRSLFTLAAIFLFVGFKCQCSAHMKRAVAKLEVRLDGLIAHPSVPPTVKSRYTSIKLFIRRYFVTATSTAPVQEKKST